MSEHDEGGGNWVWPFVLGVIVGILLMLGVGGVLMTTQVQRERARVMDMERLAAEEAARAHQEAERAAQALAEAEAKLKAEKGQRDAVKKTPAKKDGRRWRKAGALLAPARRAQDARGPAQEIRDVLGQSEKRTW
jgi:hypothetical protein